MTFEKIPYKIYLTEDELPKFWYNVRADMKTKPAPLLNPATGEPMTFEDLRPVFCDELIRQELDNDTREIPIPQDIRDFYKMYRPAPLVRAYCLEEKLQTPAKIYYKFEGNNTSGSHKLNSAIAQAFYAKHQGLKGVTTETGAGQWGTALSMACSFFDLDCQVYMVKVSYEQKPFRREVMRTYGASVTPSPSDTTEVGRRLLAQDPDSSGSLGTAISEAVERALHVPENRGRYQLGSVLNQVVLHQSIIGLESYEAMRELGEYPDIVIGCAGGGSNLGGLIAPFMRDKLTGARPDTRFIAVEPESCPSLTRGRFAYDFADTGQTCPLCKMYTLGNGFIPNPDHAGGLRYHGMSPIISQLKHDGYLEAVAVSQTDVFEAGERPPRKAATPSCRRSARRSAAARPARRRRSSSGLPERATSTWSPMTSSTVARWRTTVPPTRSSSRALPRSPASRAFSRAPSARAGGPAATAARPPAPPSQSAILLSYPTREGGGQLEQHEHIDRAHAGPHRGLRRPRRLEGRPQSRLPLYHPHSRRIHLSRHHLRHLFGLARASLVDAHAHGDHHLCRLGRVRGSLDAHRRLQPPPDLSGHLRGQRAPSLLRHLHAGTFSRPGTQARLPHLWHV